ncbi:glycosyltransferase [Methylomonas rivi]|uniref:Glycosyltransferase n=1 Tax=Methylomonas rivi TaxID=2952226 RepID=A0ABT1U4A4_9GAMM|nr:glycosyltransferase [Methylomonas sp. WSC-6]MCQ8128672.1 glycosyltransferase [Methylomonas sp. WSC-6]
MKIYHIIQGINNLSAGTTVSVGAITHNLTILGNEVFVVATGQKPKEWPYLGSLKLFENKFTKIGLLSIGDIKTIRSEMLSGEAVVHGHGVWRIMNLMPLIIPKKAKTKIIWSPDGMLSEWSWNYKKYIKRPFWYFFQKPALNRVDCFHATSLEEVEDIRRLGFMQPISLIPIGVEFPEIENLAPQKENKLVFLSRIHTKKGVHLLIQAWGQIANEFQDWSLVIAGKLDSDYGKDMVELSKTLHAPRISFVGEVLGDEKTKLLSSARLFVLPTFSENFGIAIAEALAHGTPVITTVNTPWQDIQTKKCGWYINNTKEELVNTLRNALSLHSNQIDAMGINGRIWMEQDFSWKKLAGKMQKTYDWLLNGGDAPIEIIEKQS